jgi:hypothetical protein
MNGYGHSSANYGERNRKVKKRYSLFIESIWETSRRKAGKKIDTAERRFGKKLFAIIIKSRNVDLASKNIIKLLIVTIKYIRAINDLERE